MQCSSLVCGMKIYCQACLGNKPNTAIDSDGKHHYANTIHRHFAMYKVSENHLQMLCEYSAPPPLAKGIHPSITGKAIRVRIPTENLDARARSH